MLPRKWFALCFDVEGKQIFAVLYFHMLDKMTIRRIIIIIIKNTDGHVHVEEQILKNTIMLVNFIHKWVFNTHKKFLRCVSLDFIAATRMVKQNIRQQKF